MVDIYHDPIYRSFVFNTVAGISRCHQEKNTIAAEDPRLTLVSQPSGFIFPDEVIEFEINLQNVGEHVYSYFLLAQETGDGGSALEVRLDNAQKLGYYGQSMRLDKEKLVTRRVRVYRGPSGYEFNPVKLVLKSKCEQDMDYLVKSVTVSLSNYIDPNTSEPKLRWLEPCPSVEWAGEIKRDRTFMLNTQSDDQDNISVVIFNPLRGQGSTFKSMLEPNGRLQNVYLMYRQVGEQTWRNAKNTTVQDIDFVQDPIDEDNFGYSTVNWFVGNGLLPDAFYEIIVETRCEDVGGPDEFSFSREDIVEGVIDLSRPEQYGYALPLREDIIVGEEIVVVFTEDLDCTLPLSFDLQVTVEGIDSVFSKNSNLLVRCEGRAIGFQIDLAFVDPTLLIGRSFEVEIGAVGDGSFASIKDVNGNPTDPLRGNVQFSRRFGELDLNSAITRFDLPVNNVVCTSETQASIANKTKTDFMSLMDITDSSQLNIDEVVCMDVNNAKITISIAPNDIKSKSSKSRQLLGQATTSFSVFRRLFDNLQNHLEVKSHRRLSSGMSSRIGSVKIIPHHSDMKQFQTPESDREEEELLYHIASLRNNNKEKTEDEDFLRRLGNLEEKYSRQKDDEFQNLRDLEKRLKSDKDQEMKNLKELEEEMKDLKILLRNQNSTSIRNIFGFQGLSLLLGCALAAFAVHVHHARRNVQQK